MTTDTDTTIQAKTAVFNGDDPMAIVIGSIKTDAEIAADAAKAKVEGALDTAKTDVAGDAAKVEGTVETDLGEVKTFVVDMTKDVDGKLQAELDKLKTTPGTVTTLEADTTTDIDIAKAHAQAPSNTSRRPASSLPS